MSCRTSNIPTLVAARLRRTRMALLGRRGGCTDGGLRLRCAAEDRGEGARGEPRRTVDTEQAVTDVRRATRALQAAETAIGEIREHLLGLERHLRPARRKRRRSPRDLAEIDGRIDVVLCAIERIVAGTEFEEGKLLNGEWSIAVPAVDSDRQRSIRVRRLTLDRLGSDRVGYVSSLKQAGVRRVRSVDPAVAHAIVRSAVAQVLQVRDELGAFYTEVIRPASAALAVAAENAEAARSVTQDADLAVGTSCLTQTDALLSMSEGGKRPPMRSRLPVLEIVD